MDKPQSEFTRLFREDVENRRDELRLHKRLGWRGSKLNAGTREFIIQREKLIEAAKIVAETHWSTVDAANQVIAEKILENARHALAVAIRSSALNEASFE